MTSIWVFRDDPPGPVSAPVICPEPSAKRMQRADIGAQEHRIIADFEINDLEIGMWRSVSASVYPKFGGMFPWEIVAQAKGRHHG